MKIHRKYFEFDRIILFFHCIFVVFWKEIKFSGYDPQLFAYTRLCCHVLIVLAGTCGLTCSVFDTLAVNPTFSSLVTALRASGLAERLAGPDPVTIFAPTNAAFDLLPPAKVQVMMMMMSMMMSMMMTSNHPLKFR